MFQKNISLLTEHSIRQSFEKKSVSTKILSSKSDLLTLIIIIIYIANNKNHY